MVDFIAKRRRAKRDVAQPICMSHKFYCNVISSLYHGKIVLSDNAPFFASCPILLEMLTAVFFLSNQEAKPWVRLSVHAWKDQRSVANICCVIGDVIYR